MRKKVKERGFSVKAISILETVYGELTLDDKQAWEGMPYELIYLISFLSEYDYEAERNKKFKKIMGKKALIYPCYWRISNASLVQGVNHSYWFEGKAYEIKGILDIKSNE